MKIVVTGAAGMVGQNLVPTLAGHDVVALDVNAHNLALLAGRAPGVVTELAELTRADAWRRHLDGAQVVIQLHAQIAADVRAKFAANNVGAVERVLEACRQARVPHLVHLSSSVVISVAKDDYTGTKRAGEELVRAGGVPYTILRPPLMYGAFDAKHLGRIARYLRFVPVLPVPGDGRQVRQPLFVGDLCAVIRTCLTRGARNETWNVIGHEKIAFVDLLRGMAAARGWHRAFVGVPIPVIGLGTRVANALARRVVFTEEQLTALVAGDEFPVEPWTEAFSVRYTPFAEGIRQAWADEGAAWSFRMQPPH